MDKYRKCRFCKFFINRTREEINNYKSHEELKRFNGYCHRYPKREEVKYDYLCGEWIDKKANCLYKDAVGICTNTYFIEGHLCQDIECDIDVL